MSPVATALWDALTAAGGGFAFTFLGVLAVGVSFLTVLFLGSAVVALERFARVAVRWRSAVGFGVFWSLLIASGSLYWAGPEAGGEPFWLLRIAVSAGLVTLTAGLTWLLLRWVPAGLLARASAFVVALGLTLIVGGIGRPLYTGTLALVAVAALAGALELRRRRLRQARAATYDAERLLRVLAGAIAMGIAAALLVPDSEARIAPVGGALVGAFLAVLLVGLVPLAAAGLIDSRGRVEWFIAVRYLVAKRRQTFISVITGICVLGIAVGVWLLVTVLSVMNGFERTWRDEIIGNRAHFTVHGGLGPIADYRDVLEIVQSIPEVVAASPYLDAEGMVRGDAGEVMAVRVRGVDPARVGDVTDLRHDLIEGSLDDLAGDSEGEITGLIVGSQLASALGASVGDPLLLISPVGGPQTPFGPGPRLKRFRVVGVFESSFFQYDEMFTYVNLPAAQDFRSADDVVDGIEARTTDFYRSQQVARLVQQQLGFPYYTRDWKEFFPAFFQALKSERVMMFVLLTMIMVVAAFSIVSTLVMMIMEKSSDIAILKAMGAEDDTVERIFAIEGTLIGLVGTATGVIAGIATTAKIAWVQSAIEGFLGIDALPASVYQFSTLPAQLDLGQIATTVAIAMVLALGATLLPSRQGARIDPVEALRYE